MTKISRESAHRGGLKLSAEEVAAAENAIGHAIAAYPFNCADDRGEFVQSVIAEASAKFERRNGATFATYAASLVRYRIADLRQQKSRKGQAMAAFAMEGFNARPSRPELRIPSSAMKLLRDELPNVFRHGHLMLPSLMFTRRDLAISSIRLVILKLKHKAEAHSPPLLDVSIPDNFEDEMSRYMATLLALDEETGHWIESGATLDRRLNVRGAPRREPSSCDASAKITAKSRRF